MLIRFGAQRRGAGLATTLMIVAVLCTLGLTLMAVSMHNLNVSVRLVNVERSRQLAESVISLAIEKILADPDYGRSRSAGDALEMHPQTGEAQSMGRLSFDPTNPDGAYSTNNFAGQSSLPGYAQRPVPAHSAQLIGVGSCGGVTRRVEAILTVPPFPYVVACSGPLKSRGNLCLAGVSSRQELSGGWQSLPAQKLLPANLVSNGSGPNALKLGPDTTISGDVRSAGEIVLDPSGTEVLGEILRNAPPLSIPQMDVHTFDPELLGRANLQWLAAAHVDAAAYQGFVKRTGDLSITQGLVLDNAVLYVDGDLQVSGGIRGVGAVLVTGQVSVQGGARLSSDDHLALVSGGALSLHGAGLERSYFQGLVYSGGNFVADEITLVGTLIVHSAGSQPALSVLNNARLIHVPELTRLNLTGTDFSQLTFASSGQFSGSLSGQFSGGSLGINVRYQTPTYSVQNPTSQLTTSGLTQTQAAQQILAILNQAGLSGVASEDEILARLAALSGSPGAAALSPSFTLDPSLFLRFEDRVRISLWRES